MPVEMPPDYARSRPLAVESPTVGVCILAAGVARRLEPISAVIAKPAFPLGGRIPIAESWVRKFVDAGISSMAMNLHRVPDSIQGYFGDGRRFLAGTADEASQRRRRIRVSERVEPQEAGVEPVQPDPVRVAGPDRGQRDRAGLA